MNHEIKTKRLVLRTFAQEDVPRIVELAGDWDVARMTSRMPHPYPPEAALAWIATHEPRRAAGTDYPLAIALDGKCIGCAGLHHAAGGDWALTGNIFEIGYWIGKPYWGRGYATEAARALLAWGFEVLAQPVIGAGHFTDNPTSRRVLEKLDFTPAGRRRMASLARGRDVDCDLLLLARDTWIANSGIK
jgi:ribosomal-protein-alanine N-acetyltransferase